MSRRPGTIALAAAILLTPALITAQPARIGVLCLIRCDDLGVEAFRRSLQSQGYADGRTVTFEYRDAGGDAARLPKLANELVRSNVDLMFTPWGTAPALAAKRATATIPVVVGAAGDPVKAGIVASLARPGANITGVSSLALELEGKRLELVKEVVPRISRIGVLWHAENPYSALATQEVEDAARALGVRIVKARLSGAGDLEPAFAALKRERIEALVLHGYVATLQHRRPIMQFAEANKLPAVYPVRQYVEEGGLLSYGANVDEISRRAAHLAARILKGTKAADLPVEQATSVELVVNRKVAAALDLAIPSAVMLRANAIFD